MLFATLADPVGLALRAPGPSAWLGEHITYTFGSTRVAPADGGAARNFASAALQAGRPPWVGAPDPERVWELEEQLDEHGLPRELFPRRAGEEALSYLPGSLFHSRSGQLGGTLFVLESGWDLVTRSVWLATLDDGATVASRAEAPLFTGSDPMFARGAHRGQSYVKVYACERDPTITDIANPKATRCFVARAPVDQVATRASYSAYRATGEDAGVWDADLGKATPVLFGPADTLSVDWNGYLGGYVAVHGKILDHKVVVQTAPASEGPWTRVGELTLPENEHPASAVALHGGAECDDRLVVSYLAPTEMDSIFPVAGNVVFVSIDLR
jgi:hypothetical protein